MVRRTGAQRLTHSAEKMVKNRDKQHLMLQKSDTNYLTHECEEGF